MSTLLIACVGNIFKGDDGFGVEVARRLAEGPHLEDTEIVDFGIRALDLRYALLEEHRGTIIVDATQRGEPPGTLYVVEPEVGGARGDGTLPPLAPHDVDAAEVLCELGATRCGKILLVGCEPESFGEDRGGRIGLSDTVAAAVPKALSLIASLASTWPQRIGEKPKQPELAAHAYI
jgi:hydrogenase maturation protease